MNDFIRCNKVSGVYWLHQPVESIKIKVKIKAQDGVLSLPKFEDFKSETSVATLLENKTEEYNFKWQEKIFSQQEILQYSDINNCFTDLELEYHDKVKNINPSKVFTYINEEYQFALPIENKSDNLRACFERLNIKEVCTDDTSSMKHLFKSEENVFKEDDKWSAMHVMFDNSVYNEDLELLVRQESTLFSIYHNISKNYVVLSPDANDLELNPYTIDIPSGISLVYLYAIELVETADNGDELLLLLRKLHKKWEKKQKHFISFVMPPLGKRQCYIMLEILSAADFDNDNMYIEFNIKIPDGVHCTDVLRGRTHSTKAVKFDENYQWNFGHVIEITFEVDTGLEPPPLKLFFEAISSDWWGRHRTEGYSCLSLAEHPGRYKMDLTCYRPEELDRVDADSRRFFVGGCHLINDLDVLVEPQRKDANFTYVTTGSISVRWNAITQTHSHGSLKSASTGIGSASDLLHGADVALRKYQKARAKLAAATKDLYEGFGDS